MLTKSVYNFNPGPAALPREVLEQARDELLDFAGTGMSVMEISHRSVEYERLNDESRERIRRLLGVPAGYEVLYLQGGASLQFAMVPLNLLVPGKVADYVSTGSWSNKAIKEARTVGEVRIAASTEQDGYRRVPDVGEIRPGPDAAYVHLTSNETIGGVQFHDFPDTGSVPLVADMSSDFMSRPVDVSKFALIYAGAQKNVGPAGVTIVIVREDIARESPKHLPAMLRYDTFLKSRSLYNTPPVFAVYMVNLVLQWIERQGGLEAVEKLNRRKADMLYGAIDRSGGFYRGLAERESRSTVNITFAVHDPALEKQFLKEAEQQGFVGLPGHREVGHVRVSAYNAVSEESCKALVEFMEYFRRRYG